MRIWSIHPQYLDSKGLVALWREALLAQKVLQGATQGYKRHPQLLRFKSCPDPLIICSSYLHSIVDEAINRNYRFNRKKILFAPIQNHSLLSVTQGQIQYEWQHFLTKIQQRDTPRFLKYQHLTTILPHPLFRIIPGPIESWEKRITL